MWDWFKIIFWSRWISSLWKLTWMREYEMRFDMKWNTWDRIMVHVVWDEEWTLDTTHGSLQGTELTAVEMDMINWTLNILNSILLTLSEHNISAVNETCHRNYSLEWFLKLVLVIESLSAFSIYKLVWWDEY